VGPRFSLARGPKAHPARRRQACPPGARRQRKQVCCGAASVCMFGQNTGEGARLSQHGAVVSEYERKEPPPLTRRPSSGILKRSSSGQHIVVVDGGEAPKKAVSICVEDNITRTSESSKAEPQHGGGMVGALARLGGQSSAAAVKRMSFSDQHGMHLHTVHEVQDTHYKRTCLQRNLPLVACAVCLSVVIIIVVVVAVVLTGPEPDE